MTNPKNLIIFGAGASCGSDTENMPPVGSNLFDALAGFNPDGWGKVETNLANTFREDFEEGMVNLAKQNSHAMPPLQRAMAAFFFRFNPKPSNLYYSLAKKIKNKNWDGSLVTFNYERLLELSLISAGIQPVVGGSASDSSIEICLPHGCCHIFCDSVMGSASGVSFSAVGVTTNGSVRVISNQNEFFQRIQNDAFPPVMSYFEPNKSTTSCNNFVQGQRQRFSELVKSAEKIALVGFRVRENDKHVWDSLSKADATLIYCSGKTAGIEFNEWCEKNRKDKNQEVINEYFSDSFETICEKMDLN